MYKINNEDHADGPTSCLDYLEQLTLHLAIIFDIVDILLDIIEILLT